MASSPAFPATKTLTAACHCKSVAFTIAIPTTALPLKVHLCHCSICRYTHGTLCTFHASLSPGIVPQFIAPSSLASLTAYDHAEAESTRYFCSTCGCHIGDEIHNHKYWVISSAIFDANCGEEGIWEINEHIYTASAPGGLHEWLPKIGDRQLKISTSESSSAPEDTAEDTKNKFDDRLDAKCHCGGVSFSIGRPTKEMIEDPEIKDWVSPVDSTKWAAVLDCCDDCRLVNGTNVMAWAFVPTAAISPEVPKDLLIGTSKSYASSSTVLRTFCGTCGATILFTYDERPNIPDVAIGILRAQGDVSASKWLSWRSKKLSGMEGATRYDEAFTNSLLQGLGEWGKQNSGKVL